MRLLTSLTFPSLLLTLAALTPAVQGANQASRQAPAAAAIAQTGHIVSRTRQTMGGKTDATSAELWFTRTRSRLAMRYGTAAPQVQIYDGRAMYRWTDGAVLGQVWHPTGLRVMQDVVVPLVNVGKLPGRKRVGAAKVAGIPCVIYQGTLKAAADGSSWWKGALNVRVWESQDRRFPYILRSAGADASGNRLESEVTTLGLNIAVPDRLFNAPQSVQFLPPPQVRRGQHIAGAPKAVTTPVAIYLADALGKGKAAGSRQVMTIAGKRLALDAQPLITEREVDEVRLEPYDSGEVLSGQAVVLYLQRDASARLAQAAAKARGRHVAVTISGEGVFTFQIANPWPEENNRVLILDPTRDRLVELLKHFGGKPVPAKK